MGLFRFGNSKSTIFNNEESENDGCLFKSILLNLALIVVILIKSCN